jgi:hypothetical protein
MDPDSHAQSRKAQAFEELMRWSDARTATLTGEVHHLLLEVHRLQHEAEARWTAAPAGPGMLIVTTTKAGRHWRQLHQEPGKPTVLGDLDPHHRVYARCLICRRLKEMHDLAHQADLLDRVAMTEFIDLLEVIVAEAL